ncbi:PilW family protein [Rheinheimera sp.]|uniref:PilW family protein n=1 Tax=Rheinheimera sp. TaxID=1869214 RepID=UPI00307EB83B
MNGRQRGYSLVELCISMGLALVLLSFLIGAVVTGRKSALQTEQLVQLQHQAQLAHRLLQTELQNLWFVAGKSWAELQGAQSPPEQPAADCAFAGQAGSFPQATLGFSPLYTALIGQVAPACLSGASAGSELLQIRRLLGVPQGPAELLANKVYFDPAGVGRFVAGTGGGSALQLWPYHHVVYYIQQQSWDGGKIPVLMRKRLLRSSSGQLVMSAESVLDGVERLHLEMGLDLNADGQADQWFSTSQMTTELWQQPVISVRYYLLLRSLQADPGYRNTVSYQLGAVRFQAPGDPYRRLQLSSAVLIHNSRL